MTGTPLVYQCLLSSRYEASLPSSLARAHPYTCMRLHEPTSVGSWYGPLMLCSFSDSLGTAYPTYAAIDINTTLLSTLRHTRTTHPYAPHQLSVRVRLTQRLRWNPWANSHTVSHHTLRYSCQYTHYRSLLSTPPYTEPLSRHSMLTAAGFKKTTQQYVFLLYGTLCYLPQTLDLMLQLLRKAVSDCTSSLVHS